MSDRPPSGPSRPTVCTDDGSVCTNRDLTCGKVKGSVNFSNVASPGTHPSENVGQQVPQADYVATGGSCIIADKIYIGDVEGDVNFLTTTSGRAGAVGETLPSSKITDKMSDRPPSGAVGETLPSSKGCAVKMITNHKVELISHLMADPSFILQQVQAKEIITDREYKNVKSVAQLEEKVTELLDCVISKGEDNCSRFLDILKAPNVLETYPQLKGIMSKWC